MALTRFSGDADVISQLSNQPNDNDGLSAAQLKAKFDQYGADFKDYFNNVFIPEVESAINAAAAGVGTSGFSGAIILDGTVMAEKLSTVSGVEAVKTEVVRDGAITKPKLSAAVQATLDEVAGKQNQLTFDNSPTAGSSNPVKSSGIKSALDTKLNSSSYVIDTATSTTSNNPVRNSVITAAVNTKQAKHKTGSANVGTSSWNSSNVASATISGVTSSNSIIVTPAPASYETWVNCGIRCTGQGTNSITLTARSKPSSQITVQVLILD